MKKTRKIWIGVGAFILVGNGTPSLPAAAQDGPSAQISPLPHARAGAGIAGPDFAQHMSQDTTYGAGGEGGEGGEAGIDIEAAAKDPVAYGVALQVIAAHYHAGLAAYAGRQRDAGAQMFAHGLSEVYAEMEDVFKMLGVTDLGKKLEATVAAANEKKSLWEVKRRVGKVLAALDAAATMAPKSDVSAQAVRAQVAAELIDRAAAQYPVAQKDTANIEPYLDGLGFRLAAEQQARPIMPWLNRKDLKKARAVQGAIAKLGKAYPGLARPKNPKVTEADLLSAASGAKLAVSGLR
jgi:hypothetical protein